MLDKKNKSGQISEGMSWIVATLVIIVLLGVAIYAATILGNLKKAKSSNEDKTNDVVLDKSLYSLFSIQDSNIKNQIINYLNSKAEQEEFNKDYLDSKLEKLNSFVKT